MGEPVKTNMRIKSLPKHELGVSNSDKSNNVKQHNFCMFKFA